MASVSSPVTHGDAVRLEGDTQTKGRAKSGADRDEGLTQGSVPVQMREDLVV